MSRMNEQINTALMRVSKRAENVDQSLLEDTFVAVPQVDNMLGMPEHYILFGRRGTGKTHTLRRLERQRKILGGAAVYLDLRTVGSESGLYSDHEIPLPARATTLLVDVVSALHSKILELVLTDDRFKVALDELTPALDLLAEAATEVKVQGSVEREITDTRELQDDRKVDTKLTVSESSIALSIGESRGQSRRSGRTRRRLESGRETYHIVFGALASAFGKISSALGSYGLWLMLDEWSSLPVDLQPYLADMLRRTVFIPGITVKIGAIERRSQLIVLKSGTSGDYVGIELGAEAFVVDIDDYLAFEQGLSVAQDFLAELLFRHVGEHVTDDFGKPLFGSAYDFIGVAFADDAFVRFVEGSEGLPRDALELAQKCAAQAGSKQITLSIVNSSCTSHFLQSKEERLSADAQRALREIMRACVQAESRLIALRRPIQSRKAIVAELYDQRLIHRRGQGVALPDKPLGDTYDIYVVDLGCFMELINRGQLRLIDHGFRDRGIVSTKRDTLDRSVRKRETIYALVAAADRWR